MKLFGIGNGMHPLLIILPGSAVVGILAFVISQLITEDVKLQHGLREKDRKDVVIGILSARGNFQEREALRNSWLKVVADKQESFYNLKVTYRFIIGTEPCEIPIADRINEYECNWDPFVTTNPDEEFIAHQVSSQANIITIKQPIGLDFEVLHPIIIQQLGILAFHNRIKFESEVRVSIFDRVTKREVVSAIFTESSNQENDERFLFKDVERYMLPKEFKGSLVVDGFGSEFLAAQIQDSCFVNDGGGLIKFQKVTRHALLTGFFPENVVQRKTFCHFLPGTFSYRYYEPENTTIGNVAERIRKKVERIKKWQMKLTEEDYLLKNENLKNGDILFVDVKDFYRNIPRKLLAFYKWVSTNYFFNYTIKTDDDCFLNIQNIIQVISERKWNNRDKIWFGNFRINWPLDNFGKWAENEFTSSIYPAFACGSGNLLSRKLVDWIAMNSNYLHSYQGEDTSVGIWLSAVAPKIENEEDWLCFKTCKKGMLSMPNNKPEELLLLYKNQLKCNNPCLCES
eukprot:Seg2894.2 transcript_id=Seg2894.2/GoldUCD/mRNA.D3Y31 product="UDP-GalNAc:beta-1 3-N-acetylgalactosaminyltransferase 2" protein_id=Seg2894.2/GoldUCD/D3Y31